VDRPKTLFRRWPDDGPSNAPVAIVALRGPFISVGICQRRMGGERRKRPNGVSRSCELEYFVPLRTRLASGAEFAVAIGSASSGPTIRSNPLGQPQPLALSRPGLLICKRPAGSSRFYRRGYSLSEDRLAEFICRTHSLHSW